MPIHMRLRKLRGPHMKKSMPFEQFGRTQTQPVNLKDLEARFDAGAEVTPESLREKGLATRKDVPVKILAQGDLSEEADRARPLRLAGRAREDRGRRRHGRAARRAEEAEGEARRSRSRRAEEPKAERSRSRGQTRTRRRRKSPTRHRGLTPEEE